MKTIYFYAILALLSSNTLYSNTSLLKESIYNAYIIGNIGKWEQLTSSYDYKSSKDQLSIIEHEEMFGIYYGLIAYFIGNNMNKKAETLLLKANKQLEKIMHDHPNNVRLNAIHGAFLGYAIGLNPLKAPFLGYKSQEKIDKALKRDSKNPYAWLEKANSLFYAPMFVGGSQSDAIAAYKKSIEFFEKNTNNTHNWIYLNALISLANAYLENGYVALSITVYQKILRIEPKFYWVKNELLPTAQKKLPS